MTGHLLVGKWGLKNNEWRPKTKGPLNDKVNKYIHLIFFLDDGRMLALSDLRKFAKAELWKTEELKNSEEFNELGPEPLEKSFTFEKLKDVFKNKKGKIKQVLMDQKVIAGIGNIYSDEILWRVKIHPFKQVQNITSGEFKKIYQTIKEVLSKAIKLKGESISDYRTTSGEKGNYDVIRKVYQREGEKCSRCGTIIKRIKIGGRSAHFCPRCQKLS